MASGLKMPTLEDVMNKNKGKTTSSKSKQSKSKEGEPSKKPEDKRRESEQESNQEVPEEVPPEKQEGKRTPPEVISINQMVKDARSTVPVQKVTIGPVEYLNQSLLERRAALSAIGTGIKVKTSWEDKELLGNEHLGITGYATQEDANRLAVMKLAVDAMTYRISYAGMASILACAWGLVSTEDYDKRIFNKSPMKVNGSNTGALNTDILVQDDDAQEIDLEPYKPRFKRMEREICYMCAATLRLATKDSDNLVRAWDYIKRQFGNFYQDEMMMDITPSAACMSKVRNFLQDRTVVKNTLALFLVSYQDLSGNDRGMCRMLFELHLSYTGMHAYNLLLYCAQRTCTPLNIFFALLEHPSTHEALNTAQMILLTYENPTTDENKKIAERGKTWRYARIFDPEVFSTLQTKNATMLVAILALVAQKIGTTGSGDVTKIKQVAAQIENNYEKYTKIAGRIVDYIESAKWAGKTHQLPLNSQQHLL